MKLSALSRNAAMSNAALIIDRYQVAFRDANPGSPVPIIDYERGWYTIRNNFLSIGTKHRGVEIETMTRRLNERVQSAIREAE